MHELRKKMEIKKKSNEKGKKEEFTSVECRQQ